ncbi:MAG: hypothetical protein WB689_38675 [Xanthobacteraceae bacterium]
MSKDHDDSAAHYPAADPFLVALQLCQIATSAKSIAPALKRLRKLGRDIEAAERKLAAVEAQAAELLAKAERDAAVIHEAAAQRLEAAAVAEEELVLREQKIARLEAAWRYIGEPADVMSGFRAPEHTALQKAKLAHGQQPGRDPDVHLFTQDAEPVVAIDALIRRDVGTETTDAQGNAFASSTLRRDLSHKRGAA